MAEPMTWEYVSDVPQGLAVPGTHLSNICGDDGGLSEQIQDDIQPPWEMSATVLCQVQTSHTAQFDAKRLKENSKQVGHEDDEEVPVFGGSTSLDIGGIVTRVDICHSNEKPWAHEVQIFGKDGFGSEEQMAGSDRVLKRAIGRTSQGSSSFNILDGQLGPGLAPGWALRASINTSLLLFNDGILIVHLWI